MRTIINIILATTILCIAMNVVSCTKQEKNDGIYHQSEDVKALLDAGKNGDRLVCYHFDGKAYTFSFLGGKDITCQANEIARVYRYGNTINKADYTKVYITLIGSSVSFTMVPFEENLLWAVSKETELVCHQTAGNKKTFVFSKPFYVDSLSTSFSECEIRECYIAEMEETEQLCQISFQDGINTTFNFKNALSLSVEPEKTVFLYPSEITAIPFSAEPENASFLSFSAANTEGKEIEVKYDNTTGEGALLIKVTDESVREEDIELVVTDNHLEKTYTVNTQLYYIDLITENGTVSEKEGDSFTVQVSSNLPEDNRPILRTEAGWVNIENMTVTVTEENWDGPREATVMVTDFYGRLTGEPFILQQKSYPPKPAEGYVYFADWGIKNPVLRIADRNGDREISEEEALLVKELVLPNSGITSLTGLEACKNIGKLDLQDNDIRDASMLKEIPMLHWLDLKGNKNLETFDVTGCCVYFDHCEFEVTGQLNYYCHDKQIGIINESDSLCLHSHHMDDTDQCNVDAENQDWEFTMIKEHTQGTGWLTIVVGVFGFIDKDYEDGSFDRIVRDTFDALIEYNPNIKKYEEYINFGYVKVVFPNRNYWTYDGDRWPLNNDVVYNEKYVAYRMNGYKLKVFDAIYNNIYGPRENAKGYVYFINYLTVPYPNVYSLIDGKYPAAIIDQGFCETTTNDNKGKYIGNNRGINLFGAIPSIYWTNIDKECQFKNTDNYSLTPLPKMVIKAFPYTERFKNVPQGQIIIDKDTILQF